MEKEIQKNNIEQNTETLKNTLLERIKSGKINMKSKRHFVFQIVILSAIVFLTFVVAVLLASYILFGLHATQESSLLGFGARGIETFILLFPWGLLLLFILLLLALDVLVKRFKFGYHRPFVYLFVISAVSITTIGFIVAVTPFHGNLLRQAEQKNLPMMSGFYDHLRRSHSDTGVFRGTIISVAEDSIVVLYDDVDDMHINATTSIFISPEFKHNPEVSVGDRVFVAGDIVGDHLKAYGLKILPFDGEK